MAPMMSEGILTPVSEWCSTFLSASSIPTGKHVRAQGLFSVRVATSWAHIPRRLSPGLPLFTRCVLWIVPVALQPSDVALQGSFTIYLRAGHGTLGLVGFSMGDFLVHHAIVLVAVSIAHQHSRRTYRLHLHTVKYMASPYR